MSCVHVQGILYILLDRRRANVHKANHRVLVVESRHVVMYSTIDLENLKRAVT